MKIFISYGKEDQAIALKLYHDLKKSGVTTWIDNEDILPGQNWKSEIRRAIQDCDYFIMLLSSKSLSAKGFVHKEQKIALDVFDECPQDKIFIIPARLDNCQLSDERLENLKPVDLFPSYDAGLNKILKSISSGKGVSQEPLPNQIATTENTPNSSNQTSIGGDVVGGVVISGGGNTVNINSPGQPDKNRKSSDESKPKTLSPMTYAVISLIAFALGVGLLFLFIVKADNLIAQGIDARVFYILLIPLGLCSAAFLFGAMSSIAAYQGNVLDGRLRLGGPVVLFVLVVIGGFKLVPDTSSFDMTVFVHGPKGQLDLVLKNTGEVMIDLGGDRRTEKIGAKGEASFHSIPANFRTQPVSIAVIAEGFEPAKPDQKYELRAKSLYVEVKKDESRSKISGCVKDSDNNPLQDADIRIAGGLMVRSDSTGCFSAKVPPEHQQQSIRLTASKYGYETWEGSVFPETGQEIRIVLNKMAINQKTIPFNTGWIFSGYYDSSKDIYIEGPYVKVAYRPSSGKRGLIVPEKGDILEIKKPRRVIIANYKIDGLKNELISPPLVNGIMSEKDETGFILKEGLLVLVRDVTLTHFPDNPDAIWCRIVECDSYDDSCKKAMSESRQ